MTRRKVAKLNEEMRGVRTSAQITVQNLGFGARIVRLHTYPDGRGIVGFTLPFPKNVSPREFVNRIEYAWQFYPAGTFFEVSVFYDYEEALELRYAIAKKRGKARAQSFPSTNSSFLFVTAREILLKKFQSAGFSSPAEINFRIGRTIDGSRPFTRVRPPP